jgi:CheY-like chemotaxis protein
MPEMNGMMANEMASALGDRRPPVLFVSGSPIPNMLARVPAELRTSFIAKPFDLEDLEREVSALLAA